MGIAFPLNALYEAGESEGRCGTVRFDRYENVINLASETLEAAMEVVIGRADLQDIISVGFTEERFTKVVVKPIGPLTCPSIRMTLCDTFLGFLLTSKLAEIASSQPGKAKILLLRVK